MYPTKYQKIPTQPTSETTQISEIESDRVSSYGDNSLKVFFSVACLLVLVLYNVSQFEELSNKYVNSDFLANATGHENVTIPLTSLNVSQRAPPKYWVDTPHCRMPYMDPFSAETRKIYKPQKRSCPSFKDFGAIVSVMYKANSREYMLHIDEEIARKYSKAKNNEPDDVSCCYQEVVRSGSGADADRKFNLLPCSNFHQDFVVPNHVDGVIIKCISKTTKKNVHSDAFSFIQYREHPNRKPSASRRPSVLLIGMDSVSRINFRRNMPKTFEFLRRNKWFELQGYNKMGDNTYPNLMALMAGFNLTTAYNVCKPKSIGGLNSPECQLMWRYYREAGYRTAYAEDTPRMSTFNYLKTGFNATPTDYYLRPFMLAVNKHLKSSSFYGLSFCVGRHQQAEYIYDYAQQFASQYGGEPIFGLFWANSFSHNGFDSASTMDWRMLKYMEDFERSGILEDSIVFFFSDHGMRWGDLLQLPQGFLEERWPMFFIHLPKWFRNAHPSVVRSLELNRNRLTSPYDINLTLKHILQMGDPTVRLPPASGCPLCQSLFKPVPWNRTCSDVGVTDHWCTCVPYHTADKKNATKIAQLVVHKMNDYFAAKNMTKLCSNMKLHKVSDAVVRVHEDNVPPHIRTYRIKYTTNPHAASFEATCLYDKAQQSVQLNVESISRLNTYAKDSACIDDKEAKKYCICKDVAKPSANKSH